MAIALPDLATEINIQGPGANVLTIDADAVSRIFMIPALGDVQVSGLSLIDGRVIGHGGGIFNSGKLALDGVKLQENVAKWSGSGTGDGGGIYNQGSLSISASLIQLNRSDGGANWTGEGGGIYNSGNLFIAQSTIHENRAYGISSYGGGIYNYSTGDLTVLDSTISSNLAFPLGHGGGILNQGSASIYNSTINDNEANDVLGGGILTVGTLVLLNSTVHANSSGDSGGGIGANGEWTVISHSTITNNDITFQQGGGGVDISGHPSNGPVFMRNTIVANNGVADIRGALSASGYNLIGNSAHGSGYAPTDILDVDPLLGPLADNGGPTLTRALLPGSPAIDAGENADAPEFDQRGRGFPRIVNGTIDIGAFEVQATGAPIFARERGAELFKLVLTAADFDALDSDPAFTDLLSRSLRCAM